MVRTFDIPCDGWTPLSRERLVPMIMHMPDQSNQHSEH